MFAFLAALLPLAPAWALNLLVPNECPAVSKDYANTIMYCDAKVRNRCCLSDIADLYANDQLEIMHEKRDVVTEKEALYGQRHVAAVEGDELCQGCDFTIDLRCKGLRGPSRHAFFHRLTECLLPGYALIQKAREAKGQRCIMTWREEVDIEPFLSVLAKDLEARLILEDLPCVVNMDYHSAEPNYKLGASREYIANWPTLPHIVGRVPLDMAFNMKVFHQDAWRASGSDQTPKLVFIRRHSNERNFDPETGTMMAKSMWNIARKAGLLNLNRVENVEYQGNESVSDTIKMFTHAVGIVGYHGAGFVNALFPSHPVCVEEITTCEDANDHLIWRSNKALQQFNPFLVWQWYPIKRQEIFDANKVKLGADNITSMDQFIKHLPIVRMTQLEVDQLEKQFTKCLEHHIFVAAAP